MKATDPAWRAILHAQGNVQGKALYMRRETKLAMMRERGVQALPVLYGVRVAIDPLLKIGEVELR